MKLQNIQAIFGCKIAQSMHPLVISIQPSNNGTSCWGRSENIGDTASIIIKKRHIIAPTFKDACVEFDIISPNVKGCFFNMSVLLFAVKSFFALMRLKRTPLIKAEIMCDINNIKPNFTLFISKDPTVPIINIGPELEQKEVIL